MHSGSPHGHLHQGYVPGGGASIRGSLFPDTLAVWPPSMETMELFAGYLRPSAAFASPSVYLWAVVESARDKGFQVSPDKKWANGIAMGLERPL